MHLGLAALQGREGLAVDLLPAAGGAQCGLPAKGAAQAQTGNGAGSWGWVGALTALWGTLDVPTLGGGPANRLLGRVLGAEQKGEPRACPACASWLCPQHPVSGVSRPEAGQPLSQKEQEPGLV